MRIQVEPCGQNTTLTLTRSETLVLLDFLSRFDKNGQPHICDQTEQSFFWHLFSALQRAIPEASAPDFAQEIAAAREAVRHSALTDCFTARSFAHAQSTHVL